MKFSLNPVSTFGLDVKIPVPGKDEPAVLGFTFRHRKASEMVKSEALLASFIEEHADDAEAVRDAQAQHILFIAEDWALSKQKGADKHDFTAENVAELLDNYVTAFGAIKSAYALEMNGIRTKN